MKAIRFAPSALLLVTGIVLGLALAAPPGAASASWARGGGGQAALAALKADLEVVTGNLPSQSHTMMDVSYHFTNLWFAGERGNWPLAQFYLAETRSHLRWAVRVIPVRKD